MIETSAELKQNTDLAIQEWNLGPKDVTVENAEYWAKMAALAGVDQQQAKRQICANCEYYDNLPATLAEMESVPLNELDIFNSQAQRGYCHKLHIICHTPRSCQAWEEKDYYAPVQAVSAADALYGS
jgi:hypothetical protein